tara:strand:+ start:436 stop:594 length:159 start_codon:yes stop_codon:yes gene_type:complete
MNYDELTPIIERLDEIKNKLDGKYTNRYLSLNKVSELTSLSQLGSICNQYWH